MHAWYWKTPWEKDCVLVTVWGDMQCKAAPQDVVLPGRAIKYFDMWGGKADSGRVQFENGNTVVKPGADPLFLYLPADSLPRLIELPVDLRPWLKKRALASFTNTREQPDYETLRYCLTPGTTTKTMGFAGIDSMEALAAVVQQNTELPYSRFDLCYDDDAFRFSCEVRSGKPPRNNQSGLSLIHI